MNRRTFLGASMATGLSYSSLAATAAEIAKGPVRRVALIGAGWYGKIDLFRLIQVAPVEVVALCDVDSEMLSNAADMVANRQKSGKRPKLYADYKKLLKDNKLDLVLIATPDHWHALPMIDAVKAGCDVYVQKPTGIDVVESQAMLVAARKYDRVVQVGTQRRSTPHLMEAKEKIVDANIIKAQEKIQKSLGLKVNILNKKNNSGKVTIEYKDLDQFELISDLLTKH